jgi:NADH:ubiquinone oxidoreductase subunit 6 (subunit J)
MSLAQVLFYVMSFIVIGSAFFVAATKNLVRWQAYMFWLWPILWL